MSRQYEKTVRIPVRVKDGRLEFYYDFPMPELHEGAVGEVVFDDWVLKDPLWKAPLNQEKTVLIADAKTPIAFGMQMDKVPDELYSWRLTKAFINPEWEKSSQGIYKDEPCTWDNKWWVLGYLRSPLSLTLRGERTARLSGGSCWIPALRSRKLPHKAISPNQALTFVSQTFEPNRQSFTGNVFRSGLIFWRERWQPFSEVRRTLESEHLKVRMKSVTEFAPAKSTLHLE